MIDILWITFNKRSIFVDIKGNIKTANVVIVENVWITYGKEHDFGIKYLME